MLTPDEAKIVIAELQATENDPAMRLAAVRAENGEEYCSGFAMCDIADAAQMDPEVYFDCIANDRMHIVQRLADREARLQTMALPELEAV